MAKSAVEPMQRTVYAPVGVLLSTLMLAGAFAFMLPHLVPTSPLGNHLNAQCPPNGTYVAYTSNQGADYLFCVLVNFFQTLHSGHAQMLFSIDLLTSLTTIYSISLIEASRSGRPLIVAYPAIFLLVAQVIGGGYACPLWLVMFFLSGAARNKSSVTQIQAEAVLVGLIVGYCIPTVAMFLHLDDRTTAFWQPFPLWGSISQHIYLSLRPKSSVANGSGYKTVQLALFVSFLSSSVVHLGIIAPLLSHPLQFLSSIISYFPPTIPTTTSGITAAEDFLKWDGIFIYGSFLLAGLPFTNTLSELALFVVFLTVGTILLGPGAAIAVIWSWKEMGYEADRMGRRLKKH